MNNVMIKSFFDRITNGFIFDKKNDACRAQSGHGKLEHILLIKLNRSIPTI
jgi:hypothetical protein